MSESILEKNGYDHSIMGEPQLMCVQFLVGLLLFTAYYAIFLVIDRNHPVLIHYSHIMHKITEIIDIFSIFSDIAIQNNNNNCKDTKHYRMTPHRQHSKLKKQRLTIRKIKMRINKKTQTKIYQNLIKSNESKFQRLKLTKCRQEVLD